MFRIVISLASIAIGVLAGVKTPGALWLTLSIVIHSLPLAMQMVRNDVIRVWGVWLAIFLLLQYALSYSNFKTLPPLLNKKVEVLGDVMPGFNGIQIISTDEKGFRSTKPINYNRKAENTIRIFAIGGSTTEQGFVDDRKTWTHILQQSLNSKWPTYNIEVINTGVSGLRAKHHLATFNEITKYSPDIAIFLVGINDWNNYIRNGDKDPFKWLGFEKSLLGKGLIIAKVWLSGQQTISAGGEEIEKNYGEYYSVQNDSLTRDQKRTLAFDSVASNYADLMEEISQRCREESVTCVFLTQPTAYKLDVTEELKARLWMTPPNEAYTLSLKDMNRAATIYNDFLTSFAREKSHSYCDLDSELAPTTKYFYDDCHYNELGARRVGEVVTQCFIDQSILGPHAEAPL